MTTPWRVAAALANAHVHPYDYGDEIMVDDSDMALMVTGFEYRPGMVFVQGVYWLNGKEEAIWIPLWRTKLKPK